ncbi:MAG: metal-dependent hydrolase [Bacteriovoracia bacterium]
MDNVTHTLIGITAAETFLAARARRGPRPSLRAPIYLASIIGNNLPDIDFVIPWMLGGGKLNYLLHHRGHTHTFLVAIAMMAITTWILVRFFKTARADWKWVAGAALLGGCLHILADAMNNYGVHPFFPFYNGWIYGDAVFIVEPLLIFTMAPLAFFRARTHVARAVWILIVVLVLGLAWFGPFTPAVVAGFATIFLALQIFAQHRTDALKVALITVTATLANFFFASTVAKRNVTATLLSQVSAAEILQLSATPLPANPLCWSMLVASREGADYVTRLGTLSLAPTLMPVSRCINWRFTGARTAPSVTPALHADGQQWLAEYSRPVDEFRRLYEENCYFAAGNRYFRVPFWIPDRAGYRVGDLRYDREAGEGFTEFSIPAQPESCPRAVPPWNPPLQELVTSARSTD